jgi:hypothetical protein
MESKTLKVYPADQPPAEKTLLVVWRDTYPLPHLAVWRPKLKKYYVGSMEVVPTHYIYLADLVGPEGVARIADTWIHRDKK